MSLRDSGHADNNDIHRQLEANGRRSDALQGELTLIRLALQQLLRFHRVEVPIAELNLFCMKTGCHWRQRRVLYEGEATPTECPECNTELRW